MMHIATRPVPFEPKVDVEFVDETPEAYHAAIGRAFVQAEEIAHAYLGRWTKLDRVSYDNGELEPHFALCVRGEAIWFANVWAGRLCSWWVTRRGPAPRFISAGDLR